MFIRSAAAAAVIVIGLAAPAAAIESSPDGPWIPHEESFICPSESIEQTMCYRVRPGDTLWRIARSAVPAVNAGTVGLPRTCGLSNPSEIAARVRFLHERNRSVIGPNPNRLRPGMVIDLADTSGIRFINDPCFI
jgi:hypothetical protein